MVHQSVHENHASPFIHRTPGFSSIRPYVPPFPGIPFHHVLRFHSAFSTTILVVGYASLVFVVQPRHQLSSLPRKHGPDFASNTRQSFPWLRLSYIERRLSVSKAFVTEEHAGGPGTFSHGHLPPANSTGYFDFIIIICFFHDFAFHRTPVSRLNVKDFISPYIHFRHFALELVSLF